MDRVGDCGAFATFGDGWLRFFNYWYTGDWFRLCFCCVRSFSFRFNGCELSIGGVWFVVEGGTGDWGGDACFFCFGGFTFLLDSGFFFLFGDLLFVFILFYFLLAQNQHYGKG